MFIENLGDILIRIVLKLKISLVRTDIFAVLLPKPQTLYVF